MQSLSWTTWSRKALPMVFDTARPKYKQNTTWLGMCGRNVVRKSTPKVNILQVFMIDFPEISSWWITTRNPMVRTKVQRVGWTCKRRPYISIHFRGKEKIQRTMVSYSGQSRQKWAYEASTWSQSRSHDNKSLTPRIRRTNWRAHPSRWRLLVQRSSWPTYRMVVVVRILMELKVSSQNFFLLESLFCYSWFRLQLRAIHCYRRGVWREHPHTVIFSCTSPSLLSYGALPFFRWSWTCRR